jgi:hypothetical protein
MASKIDLELKLVSQSEQILKRLEALEDGLKVNIELSINGSKASGSNIQKQLQESLGNKDIELKNFSVSATTGNKVRKILEEYINEKPINLTNFAISNGTGNQLRNILQTNLAEKALTLSNFKVSAGSMTELTKQIKEALKNAEFTIRTIKVDPDAIKGVQDAIATNRVSGGGAGGDIFRPNYRGGTPGASNVSISGGSSPLVTFGDQGLANSINAADEARIRQAEAEISARARRVAASEDAFRRKREQEILLNRSKGFEQVDINDLGSALRGFNETTAFNSAESEREKAIEEFRRKTATGPFSDINEGRRQREAQQRAIDEFRRKTGATDGPASSISNLGAARDFYNSSFFNSARTASRRFGVPESAFGSKAFFDSSRLDGLGEEIGLSALFGLASGQGLPGVAGSTFGSIAGGAIGGPVGARIGGALGGTLANAATESFKGLTDALMAAAEAGLTFQRSVLGITATYLQTQQVIGSDGRILSAEEQFGIQNERARTLQLQARSAFADVGIGGTAESSIVQSIVSALGARGLNFSNDTVTKLAQGTGALTNILAPELATNPAVLRKDIFDIFAGLGQASRTALGSRSPRLVEALSSIENEEDAIKVVNKELKSFVDTFKNSKDAAVQIQRMNAAFGNLQTALGTGIVDNLGGLFKKIADFVSDPNIQKGAEGAGNLIGSSINTLGTFLLSGPEGVLAGLRNDVLGSRKKVDPDGITIDTRPEIALARFLGGADPSNSDGGSELSLPSRQEVAKETTEFRRYFLERARDTLRKFNPIDKTDAGIKSLSTQLFNNAELDILQKEDSEFSNAKGNSVFGLKSGLLNSLDSINKQVAVAQQSVDLAKSRLSQTSPTDAKNLATNSGLLTQAEQRLADVRNKQASVIDNLISNEDKLRSLRSGAFDRTIGSGRVAGAEFDFGAAKNRLFDINTQAANAAKAGNFAKRDELFLEARVQLANIAKAEEEARRTRLSVQQERDGLFLQSIDRTTFAGDLKGLKSDNRSLQNQQAALKFEASRAGDPEKKAELLREAEALNGRIAQGRNAEQIKPLEQASTSLSLTQTVLGAEQSLKTFALTVQGTDLSLKKVNNSLADLDKQTKLNALTGQKKAQQLLKNYQETGGIVDEDIIGGFRAAFGENAATNLLTGNSIYGEILDRNIAKQELELFLSQNERGRRLTDYRSDKNALQQQQSSLEFQQKTAPLNYVTNQVNLAKGLTELAQLTGDSGLKTAAGSATSGLSGLFDEKGNINIKAIFDKVGATAIPGIQPSLGDGSGTPATTSSPMAAMSSLTEELKNLTAALKALLPKLEPDNIGKGVAKGIAEEFRVN